MARRPLSIGQIWVFVFGLIGVAGMAGATPPVLVSAASRMVHGGAGAFDVPLPAGAPTGIESRSITGGTTIVLTFDQPITGGAAKISAGKVVGTPTVSGSVMSVSVSGLANAKAYTLTVSGVTNSANESGSASVGFRTLKGDLNASGSVTAADVNQANVWVSGGYAVTNSTFRADVDLSGTLAKADVTATKAVVGTSIAGGAAPASSGSTASPNLQAQATAGSGTLFVATLSPQSGVTGSLGYGSATFVLSSDQTNGILRFSYSDLSTPKVSEHIHGPAAANQSAGIIFDIDNPAPPSPVPQPLPDGSYQWVFDTSPTAQFTPAQIVGFIQTGQTYLNIHTSKWPGGEIRGQFTLANGSQTFTPPPPPPTITINPPTNYDASRFLQQAAFGGTYTEIQALSNASAANAGTAINDWLTAQFSSQLPISPNYSATAAPTVSTYSPSSVYKRIYDRTTTAQAPNKYGDQLSFDRFPECWWQNAASGTDQLRQRIGTAYSELFVVSDVDGTLDAQIPGLATYYDMLADDAFVNFRQLMSDITLHPIMGQYLNMRANNYSTTAGWAPNENYAREIMQLFTIGLYMLQPDGTLMLDANGLPIPTYQQTDITQFAHVYTGWDRNGTAVVIPTLPNPTTGPIVVVNFNSLYQKPMVITASKHSPFSKQLLAYTGAATYPGASKPAFIPANSSQTTTTANQELNFALDNVFNHPNVGPFVCKALIQRLVTSNPSPAYVYRCAQVFNNDGTGVRGNMKAVITAIFTDYEARSPAVLSNQFAGHVREPVIRVANFLRPFHAYSKTGKWKVGRTDTSLNQTILRSPTVFNFFSPTFAQPGPIQNSGLLSPEFDIIFETTITNAQNLLYTGIYSNGSGNGFRGDNGSSDVYLDHSNHGDDLLDYLGTFGLKATVDQIGLILTGAPLDSTTRTTVLNFIANNVSSTDYYGQVSAAIHLIGTSPRGATQE